MRGTQSTTLWVVAALLGVVVCSSTGAQAEVLLNAESLCANITALASTADIPVQCVVNKLPGGHLIELYEDDAATKDWDAYSCDSFILIPGENLWSRPARGALHLFALLYSFLGIAIVADCFMNAIETITSAEVEVQAFNPATGKTETVKEKYWNDTVANLTLMALGSSAPEILLAVVGVVTALGEEADPMGPGTIVGSASFNLLFITAVCVLAPPTPRRVHGLGVFYCTAFFSVWAYVWLLLIIDFVSPEVITLWEALVTLFQFPLLVFLAYGQDRGWDFKRKSPLEASDEPKHASYLAYRMNAVRGLSGGKRIVQEGEHKAKHEVVQDIESPQSGISSDPYAVVKVGDKSFKTTWLKRNLNPVWNATFLFTDVNPGGICKIEVYDHDDLSTDDFMGQAQIALSSLEMDKSLDTWIELLDQNNVPGGRGKVRLILSLSNAEGTPSLTCEVVEAKELLALEKSNQYVDAVASAVGSQVRKAKAKYQGYKDAWKMMKVDWRQQFEEALTATGSIDNDGNDLPPSGVDLLMHFLTVFWKAFFALIPPVNYAGGKIAFFVALLFIGVVTTVVGELAAVFGCVVGLKTSVTAITFVALGTSLPDTFASKVAAVQEETADAAIGNVTGSNSVNVFLGIGLPWTIAAIYNKANDLGPFIARSCGFGLSVFLYCIFAFLCLGTLCLRRSFLGGELGGDRKWGMIHATFFVIMWFLYIFISSLKYYGKIDDMWSVASEAPFRENACG
mmetsp:Transcript_39357/g.47705  ORF Transcript_39357/g.47705 Transcript_39357/m.47705 type:complete len:739 (+) Transcript_39357:244-2460(+)|eukprot:CAMPEP_0197847048 /NCGR_PEP_ID=MMETSP1438-20131217/5132_1 /TAXON_ID=1461541 /ORGANISM="Pterosperma sp., Strain CCMP1384" /LENGTH=738 /DNA_ID=CAMNT_0043458859 /DNA_START=244 /DNA_END=2460 /DNA_ORIENTATION=-